MNYYIARIKIVNYIARIKNHCLKLFICFLVYVTLFPSPLTSEIKKSAQGIRVRKTGGNLLRLKVPVPGGRGKGLDAGDYR